jgi:hypothetical protein
MSANDGRTISESLSPEEARAYYPDDITMREARRRYFERSGFDDATYTSDWMELPVGGRTIRLPNFKPRKKAVRIHDLNHVLTGYGTNWHGEHMISAYELGMGVGGLWAAWLLNAGGVAAGLLRFPGDVVRAYARGRSTRRSLYDVVGEWDEAFLNKTVGEVRAIVGIEDAAATRSSDVAVLALHATGAVVAHFGPALVALAAVVWGIRWALA